jgi:hypothetical protein
MAFPATALVAKALAVEGTKYLGTRRPVLSKDIKAVSKTLSET